LNIFFRCTVEISAAKYNLNISPVSVESNLLEKQLKFTDQPAEKTLQMFWSNTLKVSTNSKAGNRHGSEAN